MDHHELLNKAQQTQACLSTLPIIATVLSRLKQELSPNLHYHSLNHTLDVLHEVLLFGIKDNLADRELMLLAIAAAYHDSGFIDGNENHETRGAELARINMVKSGQFSETEIEKVSDMILDTKLIQTPQGRTQISCTQLSGYLLDADLSNLGRPDFFEKGELQMAEWGAEPAQFLQETLTLLANHEWLTPAARNLRQAGKIANLKKLASKLEKELVAIPTTPHHIGIERERLEFLARLPLLINNTLDKTRVIKISVEHVKGMLEAEAATIFLKEHNSEELIFWAPQGGEDSRLVGKRMPSTKGIVGWVLEHQQPIVVKDVQQDPRFFPQIDKEGGFVTRNLICAPLTVRGSTKLGALQILNKKGTGIFNEQDVLFTEQFANQLALAIDNAQLHQQVLKRNRQLEELGKKKGEMLRVLAHELKTPVTIIQSAAELLSSGMLKEEVSLSKIKSSLDTGVNRITKVARQLGNVALLGDSMQLQRSTFDAYTLLCELCDHFAEAVKERRISLSIAPETVSTQVIADRSLIYLALTNLISNAIRFTANDGVITLHCIASSGLAAISVTDNGIGVEEDQQSLIFEKFYEVADSRNHSSGDFEFKSGGLGLGLAAVKAIIDAHAASITLESTAEHGSRFTFHLPLAES